MENYIGYGFINDDISEGDLVDFIEKHSPEIIPELCCEVFGDNYRKIVSLNELNTEEAEDVLNYLENEYPIGAYEISEIISEAINKTEGVTLLSCRGEYIVFESLRFSDDEERAKIIRSSEDFINLISKYFPVSESTFGNVYEGSEMEDPDYHMD